MNKKELFYFPDIPGQPYPVYALSKNNRLVNFKSIIYPNSRSAKKFTRKKQLSRRSQQAKLFDMLINIGYFDGLGDVFREFPVLLENSKRIEGLDSGLFILLDYYFPGIRLAVELDSELHQPEKDKIRDEYLKTNFSIDVFRIKDLQKPEVQKKKFLELKELLKTKTPQNYGPLCFTGDLFKYLNTL